MGNERSIKSVKKDPTPGEKSKQTIGGFNAISGDKNNNGEMNKCWWTNKTS